ncbi:Thioredoxin [Nesidiocoris tenuis]|uniref:Thioredoxin n=1 Tax=Nesidiocoris tenuis TaxID=355587 RepID=A0ABN7B1Z6_9HEMI|nr:Thioredoxin [Nesidiocoris tenuis]
MIHYSSIFVYSLLLFSIADCKQNTKSNAVLEVSDIKEWKKILRTKTNVLALFVSSPKAASGQIKLFKEAAELVKGVGTMILVDCSGETAKMCKKLKATTDPFALRHYKDGEFHKIYDRKMAAGSIVNFMRDPTGDVPWDEDDSLGEVVHVPDILSLVKLLKKEVKPVMVMFYAPWCGFCKKLKPDYSAAASELKDVAVLAAIDVNRPENNVVRNTYNISGFPTLLYFKNGIVRHTYEGNNKKEDIVRFMKDPNSKPPKEEEWAEMENDVIHLTSDNFNETLKSSPSVFLMFYAPWCGHCKMLKPKYEKAATELINQKIKGIMAAVDVTKYPDVGKLYDVKGYPTLKYFKNGEALPWDVSNLRETDKLVAFMKNPTEPPPPPPPEPEWESEPSEVIHLSVDTFKPTLKKKKHALVMFYAPWCGHCKRAKPEFTNAAEHFKDSSKVALAALDCTKHSSVCKAVGVEGYPTFKYFSYYDREMKDYNGGRQKADFISFFSTVDKSTSSSEDNTISSGKADVGSKLADDDKSLKNVVNLKDAEFPANMEKHSSLAVLFYDETIISEAAKSEFVKAAADSKTVTMAVVNSSFNKKITKKFDVLRFPSIKIFRRAKFIADYTGPMVAEKIVNFVKTFSSKKDEL